MRDTVPEIFKERLLPYGVTTIKDLCALRHFIYRLRDELRAGRIVGPEVLCVGPNFTAPGGHPAATLGGDSPWMRKEMAIEVSTSEQVSAGIRELKAAGVDFLKLTYQGGDYWCFDKKLQIGKLDKALMQQIIRLWKESGARYVPTVNAMTYEKDPSYLTNNLHNLKLLYDAGVPIAMGTDNMLEARSRETGSFFCFSGPAASKTWRRSSARS